MQLVAYGAQDVFLTGTPEITFWKVSYRRHTNFAMESIENPFNGAPNFGKKVSACMHMHAKPAGWLASRPSVTGLSFPLASWPFLPDAILCKMVRVAAGLRRLIRGQAARLSFRPGPSCRPRRPIPIFYLPHVCRQYQNSRPRWQWRRWLRALLPGEIQSPGRPRWRGWWKRG